MARFSSRFPRLTKRHVMASSDIIGQVLPVTIDSLERYSLLGRLASASAGAQTHSRTTTAQVTTGA